MIENIHDPSLTGKTRPKASLTTGFGRLERWAALGYRGRIKPGSFWIIQRGKQNREPMGNWKDQASSSSSESRGVWSDLSGISLLEQIKIEKKYKQSTDQMPGSDGVEKRCPHKTRERVEAPMDGGELTDPPDDPDWEEETQRQAKVEGREGVGWRGREAQEREEESARGRRRRRTRRGEGETVDLPIGRSRRGEAETQRFPRFSAVSLLSQEPSPGLVCLNTPWLVLCSRKPENSLSGSMCFFLYYGVMNVARPVEIY